jgi:hypothetical protein
LDEVARVQRNLCKKIERNKKLVLFVRTHVLKGLFLLLEPLVSGHELFLGLIEVVLELLHLLLKIADLLLSLNESKLKLVRVFRGRKGRKMETEEKF